MTPTIACVLRSGGRYSADWVARLKRGIERHTTVPHRFVCLTDVDVPDVETIALVESWPGWWSKIELFRPGLLTRQTLYLDLDVVIVGDIAPLLRACDAFTMVHERGTSNYFNSSVMAWNGDMSFLHNAFRADALQHMHRYRSHPRIGDQAFISEFLVSEGKKPRTFRGVLGYDAIVSYKRDRCESRPPPSACVANFHGRPKPCDFETGWVAEAWK